MKKKSSARIHVSKVESARDMTLTKQSSLKSFDIKQREMKRPSTARPKYQNFIPPFALLPSTISKIEKTPKPESSTLRFLTEPSKYSDPTSITSFIAANNFTQEEEDNAKKIQKIWRKMKENKKTKSFIHFAFLLYKSRIKYPMHLWLLARRFPASISKVHYDIVVNYMKSRHYLLNFNNRWITHDFNNYLLTFDQYCKTNCFLIGRNYDIDKIIKFVKILMRPLILETIQIWQEMSETSKILRKQKPTIKTTYKYRSIYHSLFWTFIFWRRWHFYKKTKNIEESSLINHSIYLFEWNVFRAKKLQKRNIIHRAFCMRDDRLQFYAFKTMRIYCLKKIKQRNEYTKIKKIANQHLMTLTFRSLIFYHVQCSIEKSLKYRVLSNWYKISDKSVINRSCLTAMKNRKNIRLMVKALAKWKENVYENSLFAAFLFDLVIQNQLVALKIAFFLMKDFVHYQFALSFVKWKKLIMMKKRAKMFVTWSFNHARNNAIKSYLIDVFRDNCMQRVDFLNYFPFKSENDKKFTSINVDHAPISLKKKKSKLIKLVQSLNVNEEISMTSFGSTVNDTLYSFQKVESFPCCDDDFCMKATSQQIKTLFYHLVIVKSYLNKGKFNFRTNKFANNFNEVSEYRKKNGLLTIANVRKYRLKQETVFEVKRKTMIQKLNRDALLLAKKDVYLALVALHEVNPNFSIEPRKTFEASKIIKEGENISPSSSSSSNPTIEDLDELKIKRKQKHPFLNPIPTLKDGIKKTNRKQRRPHKQLFTEETNQSAKNRSIRTTPENGIKKSKREENIIVYEKHLDLSRESKKKYILEKKRKEKELLMNMPPPLDKMPTIKNSLPLRNTRKENEIQLDSHLEMTNESLNKFMNSQDIDLSKKFISKSKANLLGKIRENEEEEEEEEEEFNEIDGIISDIEKVSFPYLNNEFYLKQSSIQRRDFLTNKYFSILDILLTKQKRPKIHQNLNFKMEEENEEEDEEELFELPQNSVSRVLRLLMPKRKGEKKVKKHRSKQGQFSPKSKFRKRSLFQDRGRPFEKVIGKDGTVYSKSNDPQFSNVLFLGDKFMTKLNLNGKLPLENRNQLTNKKAKDGSKSDKEEEEEEEEENLSSSSFEIPGFQHLLYEVENFLKSGASFQLSIDEQEKKMLMDKEEIGNQERVMLIMNKLAREAVKSESENEKKFNGLRDFMPSNEELVSIDSLSTTTKTAVNSSRSNNSQAVTKKKFKLSRHFEFKSTKEKRIKRQKKKLNPESPIIIKSKFTFTQDLINSIHESSRIARSVVLSYYDDVQKIDPFEGMDTLKRNIKSILNQDLNSDGYSYYSNSSGNRSEKEKEEIIQRAFQLSSPHPHQNLKRKSEVKTVKNDVYAEEFILSIGQKPSQKARTPKRKNESVNKNRLRSINSPLHNSEVQKDLIRVDNLRFYDRKVTERPKTAWEAVRQDVKIDHKPLNNEFSISSLKMPPQNLPKKPKSHVTKMTASTPFESPQFSVIKRSDDSENSKNFSGFSSEKVTSTQKVKRIKNPKWIVESDPEITNDDIEFFLFATPFIIPPAIINDAIQK